MHIPVLVKEVIECLSPKANENFIDATFGGGGHAREILKHNGPKGKVLAIEIDPELYQKAEAGDRLILVNDSYINLKDIIEKLNFKPVSGILFDLGMSSWHLEKSGRGFSFLRDEPLDMRYNPKTNSLTAENIINNYSWQELERILKEYGEEKFAKRIAKRIIEERKANPIKTTFQLVEIIRKAVSLREKINPGTRTFQALRIAVNNELNNLERVLSRANEVLSPGGRLAVISFHSLEDRIVKNFFKSQKNLKLLTKKPIEPCVQEIKTNPRARSAKLRAGVKWAEQI